MARSADRASFPARYPSTLSSSSERVKPPHLHCRRIKSPAFTGGRLSGPATPLLRWQFNEAGRSEKNSVEAACGPSPGKRRRRSGVAPGASARKLAAGLWHLQLAEAANAGREEMDAQLRLETNHRHLHFPNVCDHNRTGLHAGTANRLGSPISVLGPKNGILRKLETSSAIVNSMERVTKWDPEASKPSEEVCQFYGHLKLGEDQHLTTVFVVSSLHTELEQARSHIYELETERLSAKKKLDHFLKKLAKEKASWQSREHEKVWNIIEAIKDDLNRERKNRQRIEIINSKLVNELAEAKLSAKCYLQDYEKERKARELMEEVCDEMAKEIGEDKAEVEALKGETVKVREEMDEERRMLQMAEVWREERVQMKLIDAKLTLEQKYSQLGKLQAIIEAFLSAQGCAIADEALVKEAEMLSEAVTLLKVQDNKEFCYQPPPSSEDIFSVFEELQSREETNERVTEQCYGYSPSSHASKFHTVSPETGVFLEKPTKRNANGTVERDFDIEDESGWETVSRVEENGYCNSPEGSDPSINGMYEESHSGTDLDENGNHDNINSEISEICSVRKEVSSMGRLWRSSCPSNGDNKRVLVELSNGRLSNSRMSNATLSPKVGLSSPSVGQRSSPDSVNPCLTRRIKGCIEWPRGMQKHNMKAKLLEARIESLKIQLRQVLKQKN